MSNIILHKCWSKITYEKVILITLLVFNIVPAMLLQNTTDELILLINNSTKEVSKLTCLSRNRNNSAISLIGPYQSQSDYKSFYVPNSNEIKFNGFDNIANCHNFSFDYIMDKRWEKFHTIYKNKLMVPAKNKKWITFSIRGISSVKLSVPWLSIDISDMNEEKWNHIHLNWEINKLQLNEKIYNYTITGSLRIIEEFVFYKTTLSDKISLESRSGKAFFIKEHDYNFLLWKKPFNSHSLIAERNKFCVAFYVTACNNCELHFELLERVTGKFENRTFTGNGIKWTEFKIINNLSGDISITVSGNSTGNRDEFWAIGDEARFCSENELSVIALENVPKRMVDKYKCVLIENQNRSVNYYLSRQRTSVPIQKSNQHFSKQISGCPPEHLGTKCDIPYKRLERSGVPMAGNTICQADLEPHCKHFSRYDCGKCNHIDSCNSLKGECKTCNETNKKPPDCEELLCPVIKNVTKVSNEFNNLQLKIDYEPKERKDVKFQVNYKKSNELVYTKLAWEPSGNSVEITNLTAGMEYSVQLSAYFPEEEICKQLPNKIEETFFTECVGAKTENDFTTTVKVNEAEIKLKEYNNKRDCPFRNYYIVTNEYHKIEEASILLKNLKRYTYYTVELRKKLTNDNFPLHFRTKCGKTPVIQNVRIEMPNDDEVRIKWNEPYCIDGFKYYNIAYKPLNYYKNKNQTETTTKETSITLKKLKSSISYQIEINSININNETGEIYTRLVAIPDDFRLSDLDVPKNIEVKEDALYLTMESDHYKYRPSTYLFNLTCAGYPECQNKEISFQSGETKYYLKDLTGHVNYTLCLMIQRQKHTEFNCSKTVHFTSLPKPADVKYAEVYSKSINFIAMRIKKPNPPNGILDMYVIKFNNQSTNFTPELCILWKDYYCLNITEGIKANNNYTFEIYAKNINAGVGEGLIMNATSKQEPSYKPYNVNVKRCKSLFNISWNYPNVTNGPLTHFVVNISNKVIEEPVYQKNLKLKYNITINEKDISNVPYNVSIYGVNDCEGETYKFFIDKNQTRYFWKQAENTNAHIVNECEEDRNHLRTTSINKSREIVATTKDPDEGISTISTGLISGIVVIIILITMGIALSIVKWRKRKQDEQIELNDRQERDPLNGNSNINE